MKKLLVFALGLCAMLGAPHGAKAQSHGSFLLTCKNVYTIDLVTVLASYITTQPYNQRALEFSNTGGRFKIYAHIDLELGFSNTLVPKGETRHLHIRDDNPVVDVRCSVWRDIDELAEDGNTGTSVDQVARNMSDDLFGSHDTGEGLRSDMWDKVWADAGSIARRAETGTGQYGLPDYSRLVEMMKDRVVSLEQNQTPTQRPARQTRVVSSCVATCDILNQCESWNNPNRRYTKQVSLRACQRYCDRADASLAHLQNRVSSFRRVGCPN